MSIRIRSKGNSRRWGNAYYEGGQSIKLDSLTAEQVTDAVGTSGIFFEYPSLDDLILAFPG